MAYRFAEDDAAGILIVGRNEKRAIEVSEKINANGGKAHYCRTDVSKEDDCKRMVATAIDKWGRLDVLVNNAAKTNNQLDKGAMVADIDVWNQAFAVNVTGALMCAKHALPHMIKQGGGVILNSSSGLGQIADTQWIGYSCSKAALARLGQHIALAYGPHQVRCVTMIIGLISTPAQGGMIPPEIEKIMKSNILLGRLGRPEEIAALTSFLASDDASFITGTTIEVTGGSQSHPGHWAQMKEFAASNISID